MPDRISSQDRPSSLDRPLPEGVRDLLFADTAAFRRMEAALQATWSAWGYREIHLPTFEYADTLATDVGSQVDAELYRFFDRHGRTLALRPDMTIPTARVVGTRLYDQPMPLRLAYTGSVFRYEPPRAGRQHEFSQAGVELIGAPGTVADAEVVALATASLQAVGLPEFGITLGHVGFFRGLLAGLALPERLTIRLQEAVARKAEAELVRLLAEATGLPPVARQAVLTLPRLTGNAGMLDDAEAVCLNATMMNALAELRSVAALLEAYGVSRFVTFDLGRGARPGVLHRHHLRRVRTGPGLWVDLRRPLRRSDRPFRSALPGRGLGADARPPPVGSRSAGDHRGGAEAGCPARSHACAARSAASDGGGSRCR